MFRKIILHIEFSEKEFRKMMPHDFSTNFSIRHRASRRSCFYLGEVISGYWENQKKVIMSLEIRKDETPVWYLRGIIEEARQREIVVMKDSKVICKGGHLAKIENLDDALDTDIVFPLEAWIAEEIIN